MLPPIIRQNTTKVRVDAIVNTTNKKMIGYNGADRAVLDTLEVDAYIDLVAEPNNPYDKDAIILTQNGEKIGYIAKQDLPAFVTCVHLGRAVYGVITDIIIESFATKYEYKTWFDLGRE